MRNRRNWSKLNQLKVFSTEVKKLLNIGTFIWLNLICTGTSIWRVMKLLTSRTTQKEMIPSKGKRKKRNEKERKIRVFDNDKQLREHPYREWDPSKPRASVVPMDPPRSGQWPGGTSPGHGNTEPSSRWASLQTCASGEMGVKTLEPWKPNW